MYKAVQAQTGEEIVILHPSWRQRINQLRGMARAGLLVCQGCRQELRMKAGKVKRPHFAHKHLRACSYGSESPDILNARAVLYAWLLDQFGAAVTLEKQLESASLPRPVDCWVETETGAAAYWLVEAGIKIEPRAAILAAFERLGEGVSIHWVCLQRMLHEKKEEYHSLLLTPTERAFVKTTPYDQAIAGLRETGASLHYLDAEKGLLTTYRGLVLFHRPNWYKGVKRSTALASLRADRRNGAFIHPGEGEQLDSFSQRQVRLEAKRMRYQEREVERERRRLESKLERPAGWGIRDVVENAAQGGEELPCATCGQITSNYWSTFYDSSGRKLCRCRECLDREG